MSSGTASANFKMPLDQASPTFAHISGFSSLDLFAIGTDVLQSDCKAAVSCLQLGPPQRNPSRSNTPEDVGDTDACPGLGALDHGPARLRIGNGRASSMACQVVEQRLAVRWKLFCSRPGDGRQRADDTCLFKGGQL